MRVVCAVCETRVIVSCSWESMSACRTICGSCTASANEEDNFTVCPLVDVGDGRGGPMTHADIFGPGHCGWLDMAEDPAWIPFATGSMEEEHEIFMVNANLDSESYGHVMLLIRDCFDDGERVEARSIYSMMSKRWRNVC
jgi:hypothetical protein